MIIECKNCQKRFIVKDDAITIKGRRVQCGNCGSRWLQLPPKKEEIVSDTVKKINPSKSEPIKKKKTESKKITLAENKKSLGLFGYVFLIFLIFVSTLGILETFKNELIVYWPQINTQLIFVYESVNNILVIVKELFIK